MRERARRHLLWLAGIPGTRHEGPLLRGKSRQALSDSWTQWFESAAHVLGAVGLVTDQEVAPLRQLLADEIARWGRDSVASPADGEFAGRARELLSARLAEVDAPEFMTEAEASRAGRTARMQAVYRFEALLRACRECGALPNGEIEQWRSRLLEVDNGNTPWLDRERRRSSFGVAELLAVAAGVASDGSKVAFAVAELYAAGTVLRWYLLGSDGDADRSGSPGGSADRVQLAGRLPPVPSVCLTDDLSTAYLHWFTGGAQPGGPGSWTARFSTAVPERATSLTAEIDDQRLTFLLPRPGR